jgi:starch phosphorylase
MSFYERNAELKQCLDQIRGGLFSPDTPTRFHDLVDSLLKHGDRFCLLADYEAYIAMQDRVNTEFLDKRAWARKCVLNIAAGGFFSSDRAIAEYAKDIWGAKAVPVIRATPRPE